MCKDSHWDNMGCFFSRLDMDLVQINILERMQKSLCKDSSILLNIHLVYICKLLAVNIFICNQVIQLLVFLVLAF
ncbi:hypothetical protein HanHA300_Chr15g0571291 [Helianthus annuus]|nr:hypothetical protein HanHA300_Chr15g0571291 [Helianthus annuus]KAJ0473650.1 hypothetical protein HanHA89_Chr15g0620761 [Helianthus annuus]KAJ0649227.1 hypothetical protein HanLR1_Chr15g0581861 [Helianthus annuus]